MTVSRNPGGYQHDASTLEELEAERGRGERAATSSGSFYSGTNRPYSCRLNLVEVNAEFGSAMRVNRRDQDRPNNALGAMRPRFPVGLASTDEVWDFLVQIIAIQCTLR